MALADEFDGEIVSVDSAQVYRGMDIGTAKPSAQDRARVAHHLVDLLDPTEAYSAARFVRDALTAIAAIRARARLPIVAGGTMLYFKALTEGLSSLPPSDRGGPRGDRSTRAAREGWPALHAELARDRSADRGAPRSRPTRSASSARSKSIACRAGPCRRCRAGARAAAGALGATLRDRADARRSAAAAPGDRPSFRRDAGGRPGRASCARCASAMRWRRACRRCAASAIGRRGISSKGESTPPTLRDRGIAATRQLAKRQLTWLRTTPAIVDSTAMREDALQAVADSVACLRAAIIRLSPPAASTT